ncbi:MAG: hypothetical protein IKS47_02455 [Bacteroidales bacterium]|nr:hypothetical protein [Bacteroidales bacterium]
MSLAAAVFTSAQDVSRLSPATRLAYDYLNQKGYVNAIDEDNDVQFVVKNHGFYLLNNEKDPTLLRISMPSVYNVDLDDAAQVNASLQAINLYNRKMKLVKPALSEDGEIFFFADTYTGTAKTVEDISEYMDCALDFMLQAVDTWLEYFKQCYAE